MVYLPSSANGDNEKKGNEELKWIDYQTGTVYNSGYQRIKAGKIPAIILVRDGSVIPHAPLAQRTDQIDWNAIELKTYKANAKRCTGLLFKPGDAKTERLDIDL
jgi:alpha-D-xyloside xylohydrolase